MNRNVSTDVLLHPEMDRILGALSDRQRRLNLYMLKEGETLTETDLLVRSSGDSEKVEMDLAHNHLPKLEEAGYIEWDRVSGEISKGPRFEEIEPLLELMENHADELPPDWP